MLGRGGVVGCRARRGGASQSRRDIVRGSAPKVKHFLRNDDVHWVQRQLTLPPFSRGFHQITRHVRSALPELPLVRTGLLHVFIRHTSASLTINENADPDVARDLEASFNAIAPEDFPYVHTCEGPDDMPAHVKAAMLGSSVSVPVADGQLCLGTWQGIFLCEHRNHASGRTLVLTLQGVLADSA